METQVTKLTTLELTEKVVALEAHCASLEARILALETASTPKRNEAQKEMTDDDARRILNGDLKGLKHKEAGERLNLSYGQIYSCRLGFTFKHIHKELSQIAGYKNAWMK
jgi:hypothetical protein